MRKLLVAFMATAITFSAVAQTEKNKQEKDAKGHKAHKKGHEAKMHVAKNLDLTAEQKTKMQTLNKGFKMNLDELKKNDNITVKEQRERREALMSEHQKQVNAILTPEQRQKAQEQKKGFAEKRNRKGQPGNKDGRAKRMTHLKDELNLTENQGQRVKEMNEQFKTKRHSIESNSQLTAEQKKEQLRQLQKQHTESLQSVLTQEQRNKMEEMKNNRPARKFAK